MRVSYPIHHVGLGIKLRPFALRQTSLPTEPSQIFMDPRKFQNIFTSTLIPGKEQNTKDKYNSLKTEKKKLSARFLTFGQ